MLFNEVKAQASGFVKQFTNGKYDLNSNWSNSTEIPQIYKPFLQYVKDYNQHTAISNFHLPKEEDFHKYFLLFC